MIYKREKKSPFTCCSKEIFLIYTSLNKLCWWGNEKKKYLNSKTTLILFIKRKGKKNPNI